MAHVHLIAPADSTLTLFLGAVQYALDRRGRAGDHTLSRVPPPQIVSIIGDFSSSLQESNMTILHRDAELLGIEIYDSQQAPSRPVYVPLERGLVTRFDLIGL